MPNRNAIVLVAAFSIIFAGYNASQQYFSAVFHVSGAENIAFISLSIVYASLAITNFWSPEICRRLGLKASLFISSLTYPVFIATVVFSIEPLIYIASVGLGFGGSILWTAHGSYLVKVTSEKERGFYSGLSFSLINLGSAAMVFAASFFMETVAYSVTYAVFAITAMVGALGLLLLHGTGKVSIKSLMPMRLLMKRRMMLLAFFIFTVSLSSGMMASSIPVRMTDLFGLQMTGRFAGIYMFITFLSPLVVGWVSDRRGPKKFAYLASIAQVVGFTLMLASDSAVTFGTGLALVAYANGSYLAIIYPVLASHFSKDLDSAMAIRMTAMSIAAVLAISSSALIPFFEQSAAVITFSVISFIALAVFFKTN